MRNPFSSLENQALFFFTLTLIFSDIWFPWKIELGGSRTIELNENASKRTYFQNWPIRFPICWVNSRIWLDIQILNVGTLYFHPALFLYESQICYQKNDMKETTLGLPATLSLSVWCNYLQVTTKCLITKNYWEIKKFI